MNLRTCDCCGDKFKELSRVEVGSKNIEWFVCGDCLTNKVPRIPKNSDVPLLSTLFFTGRRR